MASKATWKKSNVKYALRISTLFWCEIEIELFFFQAEDAEDANTSMDEPAPEPVVPVVARGGGIKIARHLDRFSEKQRKIPNPSRKYIDKISFRCRYQCIDFVLSLLSKTALF